MSSYLLDPDAVLDFQFDWAQWLADGEVITSHAVTADAGVTINSHTATGTTVTVWVSSGVDRSEVQLTCHITTNAGRQDDRTMTLNVRER